MYRRISSTDYFSCRDFHRIYCKTFSQSHYCTKKRKKKHMKHKDRKKINQKGWYLSGIGEGRWVSLSWYAQAFLPCKSERKRRALLPVCPLLERNVPLNVSPLKVPDDSSYKTCTHAHTHTYTKRVIWFTHEMPLTDRKWSELLLSKRRVCLVHFVLSFFTPLSLSTHSLGFSHFCTLLSSLLLQQTKKGKEWYEKTERERERNKGRDSERGREWCWEKIAQPPSTSQSAFISFLFSFPRTALPPPSLAFTPV